MDDIDLARARSAAATDGPWRRHGADVWTDDTTSAMFVGRNHDAETRQQADLDAELIAHARQDVLDLVALFDDGALSTGPHHAT